MRKCGSRGTSPQPLFKASLEGLNGPPGFTLQGHFSQRGAGSHMSWGPAPRCPGQPHIRAGWLVYISPPLSPWVHGTTAEQARARVWPRSLQEQLGSGQRAERPQPWPLPPAWDFSLNLWRTVCTLGLCLLAQSVAHFSQASCLILQPQVMAGCLFPPPVLFDP